MTRSPFRTLLAEGLAIFGMGFGVWLIHSAFQPISNLPNVPLVVLGALDILICFAIISYFLRSKLRAQEPLPRRWIAAAVVLLAGFLGWLTALFLDSERLLAEEQHHRDVDQQLAKLDDSLRHMGDVFANAGLLDRHAWDVNHDQYARIHDQLQASLRSRPAWDKELTRIDEQLRLMKKAYLALPVEDVPLQRMKLVGDFQLARDRAIQQAETLRTEVSQSERDVVLTRRARWQGIGAGALAGIVMIGGCLALWLVFDRELRRSWKAGARLAEAEARFRGLIEKDAEPIAVVNTSGVIVYANPAWHPAFGRESTDLPGTSLVELIHADDRPRVMSAWHGSAPATVPCRLSADYGVWHDVEMNASPHPAESVVVVRFRDVRETPEFTPTPQIDVHPGTQTNQKLHEAEARIAELEGRCDDLRGKAQTTRTELEHHRWLGSQKDAGNDGLLILSAQGQVLSWNPAFAQLWKLSAETMAAHTWLTVAAHMESLTRDGWTDFHQATSAHDAAHTDSCWEMTLEGGKLLEVYSQVLRDHPGNLAAVRFHFRDVTQHREMESKIRGHEEQVRQMQKRAKQLEKELAERDRQREQMDAKLLEHQDRLRELHQAQQGHESSLQSSKEEMRKLAGSVANDINGVLSVILGNTDVLRDNLPPDHVAQHYLNDIHQAASKGTQLSQRLCDWTLPEPETTEPPQSDRAAA